MTAYKDYLRTQYDMICLGHERTNMRASSISLQLSEIDYDGPLKPELELSLQRAKAELRFLSEISILFDEQENTLQQHLQAIEWRTSVFRFVCYIGAVAYIGFMVDGVVHKNPTHEIMASVVICGEIVLHLLMIGREKRRFKRRQRKIERRQNILWQRREQERAPGTT